MSLPALPNCYFGEYLLKILVWQGNHGQMFCSVDGNEEITCPSLEPVSPTFCSRLQKVIILTEFGKKLSLPGV